MPWTMDELVPRWDHAEEHSRWLPAEPERVWDALWGLRVSDLDVSVTLSRLRGGPRAWFRDASAYAERPVIESMAPRLLVRDRPDSLVLVDVARYTAARPSRPEQDHWEPEEFAGFAEPGWTKVAMDFRLTPKDKGTELTTRTRVVSTDARTRRSFALYWTAVRLGSGMVRSDILRAVARTIA